MWWCTRQARGRPSQTLQSRGAQGRKEALTVKCAKCCGMESAWLRGYLLVCGAYGSPDSVKSGPNVEEGGGLEGVP